MSLDVSNNFRHLLYKSWKYFRHNFCQILNLSCIRKPIQTDQSMSLLNCLHQLYEKNTTCIIAPAESSFRRETSNISLVVLDKLWVYFNQSETVNKRTNKHTNGKRWLLSPMHFVAGAKNHIENCKYFDRKTHEMCANWWGLS